MAEEIKKFLALSLYLYICLGALMLLKTAILQEEGISFALGAWRPLRRWCLPSSCLSGMLFASESDISTRP